MKNINGLLFAAVSFAALATAHAAVVLESAEGVIDLRPDPRPVAAGASETLTYGDKWADPATPAAAVTITLDGETFATLSDGEGTVTWTPSRGGLYTFMHTATDSNGVSFGDAYSASFLVADFPFEAGAVSVTGWSGVYDAQPHVISASNTVSGASVRYATTQGGPYSETHPVITAAGTHTVWCEVSAPGYLPQTNSATIAITKRPLTIAAAAKTKTYGAADPVLTYTATGLVGSDRVTGSPVRDAGEAVGTYAIRQGSLTAGDNYAITYTGANFTINPATIRYVSAGSSGTYCGQGFGITVDVSSPASGALIQYATSATGPWQNTEIKYTNACSATPIWFKISAAGYTSVTNSRTVAIAPKQLTDEFVWLTLPPQDYVYDGTGKTPGYACVDGSPSIITTDDVDIAFTDNVDAGTATATFTGKRNYTGTVEEEFDILPRPLTIAAEAKTKAYGEDDPALTYTATGLVGTDKVTGALVRDAGEAVGTYAIRQGTLAASENYALSFTGADFTITALPNAVWYVDATNGVDTADGFSWATAKKTIQAALDLAEDGNQIIVTNGVYTATKGFVVNNESRDRIVTIRSVNGPEVTIIDGGGVRRCAKLSASHDGRTSEHVATLSGFTLRNGVSYSVGGVAHGVVENCIITGCTGTRGITSGANYGGGAVECKLVNCLLAGNSVTSGDGVPAAGGAWRCDLYNCTVVGNAADAGAFAGGLHNCKAYNCIVTGNTKNGVESNVSSSCTVANSCLGAAFSGTGNIMANPHFVDAANGDYRLSPASPCIDAGDSARTPAGTDLDGNPRVVGDAVDMGCYEVQSISLSGASITIGLEGGPFTYDGTAHEPAAAVTNGTVALVAGRDFSVSYLANVDAGTAKAIVTGCGVYRGAVTNAFQIAKRPVTIVAAEKSKTYGTADPALTYTAQGLVGTDKVTGTLVRDAGEAVGTYAIRQGTLTAGNNYAISYAGANLTISKKALTVTAAAKSKTYGAADPALTYTVTGLVGSDQVTGALVRDAGENVGTYAIRQGTLAASANYALSFTGANFIIAKATLPGGGEEPGDGTVPQPQGGVSKFDATTMYDGKGHTIDTNALVAAFATAMGEGCEVAYARNASGVADATTWASSPQLFTNVCAEMVWYRVTNPNYADFVHAAKVIITNRPVTVSVTGHTATYAYDTTAKTVTGYDIVTEDALYDIAADTVFGGTATASRIDVGTTAMGLAAADFANNNANFLVAYAVTDGGVTVAPRVIGDDPTNWDIRLAKDPTYNGREQSAPITQVAFVKPDGNLDYVAYALAGDKATDAGNYVVRISGTGNYAGTVEKEWAIMPRNVTLASGSATWTYDGAAHSEMAVTVTGDGFAAGEGATYSGFPSVTHVADAATPTANAFAYALNANTKAKNYVIATVDGTVLMQPRAITLTAPTKEKDYDGQPLTFAAGEVAVSGEGYATGESFTLGGFSSITEAGQTSAAFTVADGSAFMADYAITTAQGTLTVKKSAQEITVTARSGSWTYDGQTHVLHEYDAANLAALVAGDTLEVTFDDASAVATPVDGAGRDGVVPNAITGVRVLRNGTADVTANYTLAWYPGTLTVSKRPVTLTSKSASKAYDGQPLTAHEATVGGDGFVGTDGATFTFSGTQTAVGTSANAFQYALKAGTRSDYYAITKVEGELAVTPLDITGGGTGDDPDWQIVLGPSPTYNGLPQIQTITSVKYKGLDVDYSVTGNQQTDAGAYTMTISGQGNFSGAKQADWSIAPKALTLTAGSGSRVYDGTALTVASATAEGFVAGEGATFTCDGSQTDAGTSSNGVATIAWNANTKSSNYAVTKVAGTLTVTPRTAAVASADISKPYDGTALSLTAAEITVTGLVEGESLVYSDFASRTEAGQTPATFAFAAGPGTSLGNYAITPSYGTITIAKSATEIGVTAASGRWTYDGQTHSNRTYTATNLETLQPGDALEVVFDPASVATTPQDGPEGNGLVPNAIASVRVLRNGAQDVTGNYTVTAYPGTLEIVKRAVVVSVAGHTASATYDGTAKTATGYDATTTDALYDIAACTVFGGTAEATRTDAGTTAMGLSSSDFTNNNPCFDVTYQVADGQVAIAPLDIASGAGAEGFSLVLGANPKYNGTVQAVPVESVTCDGLPVTYVLAGENATHAGVYTLTVKANGNFTGERSTTWQMLKRAVTLTSGSATKVYDGSALANPNVTVGGDGFIGLEGATFSVTGSQTAAGTGKNTFGYELKVGTRAGDYDIVQVEGDLTVTRATLPPSVFGPWDGETPLECEKVFNGMAQPVEIIPDFDEPYTFLWSLTDQSASVSPSFLPSAPTLRDVADGEVTLFFKFVTDNYEPVFGSVLFRIAPKTLTDEMVVLTDEAFYYDQESGQKTPDVTVTDTNAYGVVISTEYDYEISYGDSSSAGAIPVIATGMNNYTGTVTKTFPVLKRPVAPPIIDSPAYNGRKRTPAIPSTNIWTVVANPGGIDAGLYTNVVLRLTNPDDYKWRGFGDDQIDWIGVFEIRKAGNGWSQLPGIAGWTQGEAASEPILGRPRYGSVSRVLYRARGAAPETGTETVPSRAGLYTAQFVVDETANYAGTEWNVDFEILPGAGGDVKDHTETTGVPVPYVWLDPYLAKYGNGDYEAAGNAIGLNGCHLWESYLAGLDPENPLSRFLAFIAMQADGTARITWYPDLSHDAEKPRVYTVLGKANLADHDWTPVTDKNKAQMRFFKVKVELP